ncbi:MAG: SGNH/GDSL hydrolase family protein [Verrucomicrobia bacterium]|nr:SGNH/GDSL hydrolase family protein [Verrucomicrobiota bacterium]
MSKFLFQNNNTVLFIGDSITDAGRRAQAAPLGEGYVKLAIDLVTARYPERKIRFINKGIGGNTVRELANRWHDDVIRHRPDWLSIMIGINDLHRALVNASEMVTPEQFQELYRNILDTTRQATKARVILIDPFYISQDRDHHSWRNKVLEILPRYLDVVRKMTREFKTLHVRSHEAFQQQLRYREADRFCPEPVHPNLSGHIVIAHEFLRSVGW